LIIVDKNIIGSKQKWANFDACGDYERLKELLK
jgi:hypothetical protein